MFKIYLVILCAFIANSIQQSETSAACNHTCDCSNECDCVPKPSYIDPPICPQSNLTLEDGIKIAWRFAPILYFHPLDWSYLETPLSWMRKARAFDPVIKKNTTFEGMNLQNDSWTDWTQVLSRMWMSVISDDNSTSIRGDVGDLIRGAKFENGTSTAEVYFTAFEADNIRVFQNHNAWVFTYHYFYPFQGCKTHFLSIIEDDQYQGAPYYRCPSNAQETDWERITVYVCKADEQIRQIQYSQGKEELTQYECPNGQCPSMENYTHANGETIAHPVSYVALFSHSNYPHVSKLWIYNKIEVEFFVNMDGLYDVDFTRRDSNLKFVPTANNMVYLPRGEDIDVEDVQQAWGLYTGGWGTKITSSSTSITCFNLEITETVSCEPNTFVGRVIKTLLGPYDSPTEIPWEIDETENKTSSVRSANGPLTRDYTYLYSKPQPVPIWKSYKSESEVMCPFHRLEFPQEKTMPEEFKSIDVSRFIWGMVLGIILVGIVLVIVLLVPIMLLTNKSPQGYQMIIQDEDQREKKVTYEITSNTRNISLLGYWVILGLCLYIIGVVIMAIGINDLFDALQKVVDIGIWQDIRDAFIVLLVLMGFFDLCLILIAIFLQTSTNVQLFGFKVPNCATSKCCAQCGWQFHAISAGILVIVINVSLLLFGFGFMVWCGRFVLSQGCELLFSVVADTGIEEMCLDLTNVGLEVYCGQLVVDFCVMWNNLRLDYIIWGSFPLLLSHIMFLCIAIVNYCDARSSIVTLNVTQSGRFEAELPQRQIMGRENADPNIFDPAVSFEVK